jgi:hypothetical protein
MAVDAPGHWLALNVTAADVGDREAIARLGTDVQDAMGEAVTPPNPTESRDQTAEPYAYLPMW